MEATMNAVEGAWEIWRHIQALVEAVVDTLVDDNVHCNRCNTGREVDNKVWALALAMQDGDLYPLLQLYRMVWRYYL